MNEKPCIVCPRCGALDCQTHLRIKVSDEVFTAALQALDAHHRTEVAERAIQKLRRHRKIIP